MLKARVVEKGKWKKEEKKKRTWPLNLRQTWRKESLKRVNKQPPGPNLAQFPG